MPDPPKISRFLRPLRRVFEDAGYTAEGLLRTLGPTELPGPGSPDLPYLLHLTRERTPLNTLIRLFLLDTAVPAREAAAALAPFPLERAVETGFVSAEGDTVAGRVRVLSFRGLLLACDQPGSNDPEQVMGIMTSTAVLADFAVRTPGRCALDLGTGCGALALVVAPCFDEVIASDVNKRATAFARFNAAWNEIPAVTTVAGDSFEPVRGRRFNLIISNPPFVISPDVRFKYRDAGMAGDAFTERLVRNAPAFLNEPGFFQFTCDCVQPHRGNWRERMKEWFQGSGCDAWVMATETHGPPEYVRTRLRDSERGAAPEKTRLFESWVGDLERQGIETITTALVAMRRRSGANWVRFEDAPESHGSFGRDVALGFALHDYLDAASDASLMAEKLVLHPDARLDHEMHASGGSWKTTAARIRITSGLRYAGSIDGRIASLLARSDGSRPVRDLVARLAADAGVNPERVAPDCLALLRRLIAQGFLIPAALKH